MNWKLIFQLSLFGFVMAFATVFLIPGNIEMLFWLPIFIVIAYIIAKKAPGRYFLHGFFVSILNCVYITSAHILFYDKYIAGHAEEAAAMMANGPMPTHPRIMMLIVGPFFGIAFGLIIGLFSWVASKMVKK